MGVPVKPTAFPFSTNPGRTVSDIDQSQPTSKWGKRLSLLALLLSSPVVAAILLSLSGDLTGMADDDGFVFLRGMAVLFGTLIAMLVCVPALILGIAGVCLDRSLLNWIALLFSLVPAGLMSMEAFTFRQYQATERELEEQTRLVSIDYGYDELKRNADGSIERVRGGSSGGSVRLDESGEVRLRDSEWVPPKDGRIHWVALRVDDDRVKIRIHFPNDSTSDINLLLGEQHETWDPTNQYGVRLTIDELGDKKATTERLLKQAKDDHHDPIDVLVEALSSQDIRVAKDAASQLKEMGKGAVAVPILIDRLRDQRSYIRDTACRQIQEIGPQAKAAVPTLIELLSDEDEWTRRKAAAALAMMRTEAKAAAPTLRRLRDAEPVQSQSHEFFNWA